MRLLDFLADAALPPRETEARIRGLDADAFLARLAPVMRGEGAHAAASLFPYRDPLVEACILEAKFEGSRRAAGLLGRALREFLHEWLAERAAFDPAPPILVPLPLSATRLRERGYNQVEHVARVAVGGTEEAGEKSGEPARVELTTDLLCRTRATAPQTSLSGAERRANVAGAFGTTRPCDPSRTYMLVDDVVTTGNTMAAAAEAMRAGGASRLLPLTFAY